MDKTQLDGYRQQLLALAHDLRGRVDAVSEEAFRAEGAEASGTLSDAPVHPADLSSDTYEHEVAIGLVENEGALLDQVIGALQRLDAGTFGRCPECGQQIPTERLQAVPYALHCVKCATRLQPKSA